MATTFDALHRRNRIASLRRLMNEQRVLADRIGRLLLSSAAERDASGAAVIPNRRVNRDALKLAIWLSFLKPYYWGRSNEPWRGPVPHSPFAATLFAGINEAVDIEVVRQVSIAQRLTRDAVILDWLFGRRNSSTVTDLAKPTFAEWVDPSGLTLADRTLRAGIDARARLNKFIDHHVGQAAPVQAMASRLQKFLTTGEKMRTAYGQQGSWGARRLLLSETKVAAGYAAINASVDNPMVAGIQWRLNRPYDETDQCDRNSTGGPLDDGVYPALKVPTYPDHPNEQCDLLPVPAKDITDELRKMHDDIMKQTEDALKLAGKFSPEALRQELLGITASPQLSQVSPREWVRQADGTLTWQYKPGQGPDDPPTALLRQRQAERAALREARNT